MTSPSDVTPDGAVFVEDGRVVALHEGARRRFAEADAAGRGGRRVEASGLWLLPGFVQTHLHLCQTLLRGGPDDLELLPWLQRHVWPGEAAHDDATLEVSARLGLAELAAGGTTSILDMGTVRHTDAIFRAAEASGLRVASGNAVMDDPAANPAYLQAPTDDALAELERLADRWHGAGEGRLRVAFCPRFVPSCTEKALTRGAEIAARRGLLVHTHASENRTEIGLVRERTGRDNVAYLDDVGLGGERVVLAHAVHTSEAERDLLARRRTGVTHCPSSNLKLASGIAPVPEYLARGIRVGLGADGAPCNDRLDAFAEMRLAALLPKIRLGPGALRAWDVVRMATAGGAEVLGLAAETGTIAPGKRADLVLLDPEAGFALPDCWREDPYGPLVYAFSREHVVATLVDGVTRFASPSAAARGVPAVTAPFAPTAREIRAAASRLAENRRRIAP